MNATDELVGLCAKTGVDFETQFVWADVDDSTDPATETPIDLTGYSLTMRFRRRAGEADALTLTSEDDGGIDLADGDEGVIAVAITEAQLAALFAASKRWAWRLDGTSGGGKKYAIAEGYLDTVDWPNA